MAINVLAAGVLASSAAIALGHRQTHALKVRRFEVSLPGLPRAAEGLKIVQISDLHVGALTNPGIVERAVGTANSLAPDVVALTGDFVSRRSSYFSATGARRWARPIDEYATELAVQLRELNAPQGVFGVPGNHDVWEKSFDPVGRLLQAAGVVTLVNAAKELSCGLSVVGLDDLRGGHPDFAAARGPADDGAAQLILSHNPRAAWMLRGRRALILSGHTHGGQIHLPCLGVTKLPVDTGSNYWLNGFYSLGTAGLYVSPGVGTIAVPLRFGVPPEITLFTLLPAVGNLVGARELE